MPISVNLSQKSLLTSIGAFFDVPSGFSIPRDCAEMAAKASLYRRESRWGLYHYRLDFLEKNNDEWFSHVNLKKDESGQMVLFKRPVEAYVVEVDIEKEVYNVAVQ